MLNQLGFKLQVERQYQKGFDLMQRAYNADGDKKSRQDAQNQKQESDRTIQLLSTALRRYKNLHVIEVADEEDAAGMLRPSIYSFPHFFHRSILPSQSHWRSKGQSQEATHGYSPNHGEGSQRA